MAVFKHSYQYASVADAITFLIIMHSTFTSTFYGGIACIDVLNFGTKKKTTGSALCDWF